MEEEVEALEAALKEKGGFLASIGYLDKGHFEPNHVMGFHFITEDPHDKSLLKAIDRLSLKYGKPGELPIVHSDNWRPKIVSLFIRVPPRKQKIRGKTLKEIVESINTAPNRREFAESIMRGSFMPELIRRDLEGSGHRKVERIEYWLTRAPHEKGGLSLNELFMVSRKALEHLGKQKVIRGTTRQSWERILAKLDEQSKKNANFFGMDGVTTALGDLHWELYERLKEAGKKGK